LASTYLQLTNFVLTRLNEVNLTSTTFASAVGFQSAAKNFVNDALNEINSAETEWPFNFNSATITLTADSTTTQTYSLESDMATADWDSFLIRPSGTTITTAPLRYIPFDYWRKNYKPRDKQVMNDEAGWGKPEYVFQTQENPTKAGFSPVPDEAYVVEYEYWKKPTALSEHGDTHTLPDRFEYVILDGAMMHAYNFRDNVEEAALANKKFYSGIMRMRVELINKQNQMLAGQIV
jgi:hypothetical protein